MGCVQGRRGMPWRLAALQSARPGRLSCGKHANFPGLLCQDARYADAREAAPQHSQAAAGQRRHTPASRDVDFAARLCAHMRPAEIGQACAEALGPARPGPARRGTHARGTPHAAGAAPAGLLRLGAVSVGVLILVAVAGGPRARLRGRPLAGRARPHRRLRVLGRPVPAPRHRPVSAPPGRLRCRQARRAGRLAAARPCVRLISQRVRAGGLRVRRAPRAGRARFAPPRASVTQHELRAQRRGPSRRWCHRRPTAPDRQVPLAPGVPPPCQRTSTSRTRVCCATRGTGKPGNPVCRLRPGS